MAFRYQIRILIFIALPYSSVHAHVHVVGNLLHGSGMKDFPNGTYDSVKVLNFINNNFSEFRPYIFYNHGFRNLEKALLRNNSVSHIHPNSFAMMSKLLQLDLYGNSLATMQNNSFAGLESLQNLHLGNNVITSIDKDVFKSLKSLETLDLSDNDLTLLTNDFLKNTSVLELDLRANPLIFPQDGAILESSSLTRLFMSSCNLTWMPPNAFGVLPNLKSLDLSRNKLKSLQNGLLKKLVLLEYLDVSFNLISVISTGVFSIPTKVDLLYCNGNPLKIGMDCAQILVSLHNMSAVAESAAVDDHTQTTFRDDINGLTTTREGKGARPFTIYGKDVKSLFGALEGEISPYHNHGESAIFKSSQSVNTDSTNFEDEAQHHTTPQSKDVISTSATDVIIYSIIVVSIICLILLVILLVEICYLMKQYDNSNERITLA